MASLAFEAGWLIVLAAELAACCVALAAVPAAAGVEDDRSALQKLMDKFR